MRLGRRQYRRPYRLSGGGRFREGSTVREKSVHCVTLQAADFDGLLVIAVIDAGAFAENVHGADTGAAGAQNVGVEDGECCPAQIALCDFLDEAWDFDMRRAGRSTRCVEAVKTAVGFDEGGGSVKRRMEFRKAGHQVRMRLVLGQCAHIHLVP